MISASKKNFMRMNPHKTEQGQGGQTGCATDYQLSATVCASQLAHTVLIVC